MEDKRNYDKLKKVVADCFNKTMIIAKNIIVAPFSLSEAIEADLKEAKTKQFRYPKGGITFTLDDEDLQNDLNNRIEFLRGRNARNLVEQYSNEIIKKTLEKDNYLIGYNQAIPQAVDRINYERRIGLLDDFYLPVEKCGNDDNRNYKRG